MFVLASSFFCVATRHLFDQMAAASEPREYRDVVETLNSLESTEDAVVHELSFDDVATRLELKEPEDLQCVICSESMTGAPVASPSGCERHWFHEACIAAWFKTAMKCPVCSKVSGARLGPQPDGHMVVTLDPRPLRGYEGYGTLMIEITLPASYQSADRGHPHPGRYLMGEERIAYLPDTEHGRQLLQALQVAFEYRWLFTVGPSLSRGGAAAGEFITFGAIHLKTELFGTYGYPDATYLTRLRDELLQVPIPAIANLLKNKASKRKRDV